jgi:hypothetical protein
MFSPSTVETTFLRDLRGFMNLSWITAAIVAILISGGLYWLATSRGGNQLWRLISGTASSLPQIPPASYQALYAAAAWQVAVLAAILYALFYPQYVWERAARMQQTRQLESIQRKLGALEDHSPLTDEEENE